MEKETYRQLLARSDERLRNLLLEHAELKDESKLLRAELRRLQSHCPLCTEQGTVVTHQQVDCYIRAQLDGCSGLMIDSYRQGQTPASVYMYIHYCPLCGRKLE